MKKKEIIMLIIIVFLVIGLIIMMQLYLNMRKSSKLGLESTLNAQNEIFELNKKISELEDKNESLKKDLEQYKNPTKIISQSYGINYHIENDVFYTDKNNIKIISADDAAKIAVKEAKKEKYQYQSWKLEFYARGKDNNEVLSATLLDGTKTIDIKKEWKNANYNDDTLIWEIRLFDSVDPLTSLFVYINAIDGTIIGAQELSD